MSTPRGFLETPQNQRNPVFHSSQKQLKSSTSRTPKISSFSDPDDQDFRIWSRFQDLEQIPEFRDFGHFQKLLWKLQTKIYYGSGKPLNVPPLPPSGIYLCRQIILFLPGPQQAVYPFYRTQDTVAAHQSIKIDRIQALGVNIELLQDWRETP